MPMEWNPNILQCVAGFVPLAAWNTARVTGKGLHAAICELSTLDGLIGVCQDLMLLEEEQEDPADYVGPFLFDAMGDEEKAFAREFFPSVVEGKSGEPIAVAIAPMSMKFFAELLNLTGQVPPVARKMYMQCNSHVDSVTDVDEVFESEKIMYDDSSIRCPEADSLYSAARWVMRRLVHTYSFLYLHVEYSPSDNVRTLHTILLYEKKTSGGSPS